MTASTVKGRKQAAKAVVLQDDWQLAKWAGMLTLEREPGPASLATSVCTTAKHGNKTHCPTSPLPACLLAPGTVAPTYTFPNRFEVIFQVLPSNRVREIAHVNSSCNLNLLSVS